MKIGFFNFHPMMYDVETPLNEPLGGSESAMCYLAVQLADLGHDVTLFRRFSGEYVKRKVNHLPVRKVVETPLDVLIIQNTPYPGAQLRLKKLIKDSVKLVFWSQHASNQPPVETLHEKKIKESFDKVVLISKWQQKDYKEVFGFKKEKVVILKNAISPAFENLKNIEIKEPLSMAYTSTPFRGLGLLIEIFSTVKSINSNAKLDVFSSMNVYQAPDREKHYEKLYEACRQTFGINYVGSLPQKELAKRLSGIEILAYPNIFPETSCIAVMEAMAAGCQIVTSKLGALPETAAGFARLLDITKNRDEYYKDFVKALLEPIDKSQIKKQVEFVNKNYTWKVRAKEWDQMLKNL